MTAATRRRYGNARAGKPVRIVQQVAQELDEIVAFAEKGAPGSTSIVRQIA
jgi:hypothetical protein